MTSATDLTSGSFDGMLAATRSWTNLDSQSGDEAGGNGIVSGQLPFAREAGTGVQLILGGIDTRLFAASGGGYASNSFLAESLVKSGSGASEEFAWTDTAGGVTTFYGFDSAITADQRGHFKSYTSPSGLQTTATYNTGLLESVECLTHRNLWMKAA